MLDQQSFSPLHHSHSHPGQHNHILWKITHTLDTLHTMARTKQYARRNACGLPAIRSRPRSLDSRIGAHEPQHADDDVEQRDDTDELEDRPRSQSEHVHDTRSVSPDSNLLRPSSSGPGVEDPTEPNIQNKFRMNADFHLDDDNSDDDSNDDDTPPPPEKANKFSTRPDGFASSATQGTILNADDDSAQSSQNNSNHFGSVPPTCDSASAALPKDMDQTEAKEKDVKYDTTRTNNKKRILAPTSEEGENDPRVKKGKFHSVDGVDVTKSSNKAVEALQQVVNESSDGSDVTKESVKAIEPANGKDDDKTDDLNENTAAQEFTHGAFLDFETIPGSPIQAFDSAALKAEQMTMADEFDAKLTIIFEEYKSLNGKIENWVIRGAQMQSAREDCLISHKLQEVNKTVYQATKQRDELVGFCRQMQQAFSMFFPETL